MRPRSACIAALLALVAIVPAGVLSASTPDPYYSIAVAVDYAAASFAGELRLDYHNATGAELGELLFRLYPNGGGIYGGASMRATRVLVEDAPVVAETFVDDTILFVPLPEPLPPGEQVHVTIAFEGVAEHWTSDGPGSGDTYGLLTKSRYALTLTAFYPILAPHTAHGWALEPVFAFGDALMSDASTYDVSLTIPAGVTPVTSGTLRSTERAGETFTHRYEIQGARDFSVVLLDGYEHREEAIEGTVIHVWFRPETGRAARIAHDQAIDALALFTDLIGPLPYGEIDLVEVPMQHAAGVELSGLILISSAYAQRPEDTFFSIIVSHEMAHQWFYAAVGNDINESPWLDEGVATYLSYLFVAAQYEPAVASEIVDHWARSYEAARAETPHATIASPIYEFSRSSTYSAFVYSGAALFLHAIREAVGDDAFFRALASYYAAELGHIASPSDLLSAFERSCECQLAEVLSAFGLHR